MVQRSCFAILLKHMPHPLALMLATALMVSMIQFSDYLIAVLISIPYCLLIDRVIRIKRPIRSKSDDVDSAFLLAFARNLKACSPEKAFIMAYESSQPVMPMIESAAKSLRDGIPLIEAFRRLSPPSKADRQLFAVLAGLISFSREETSSRLQKYVDYRAERDRTRNDLLMKLNVVSLRMRVLSIIGSSSLAVIAFTSPILESFFKIRNYAPVEAELIDLLGFNMHVFLALLSIAVLSPYLLSKMTPFIGGGKAAAASALAFVITYVFMIIMIGVSL